MYVKSVGSFAPGQRPIDTQQNYSPNNPFCLQDILYNLGRTPSPLLTLCPSSHKIYRNRSDRRRARVI